MMTGYWLLAPMTLSTLAEAHRHHYAANAAAAAAWETAALADEQRSARALARDGELPRGMSIAGSVAEIRVDGVLTKKPDWISMFFGGGNTTYTGIRNALAIAETEPSVKTIVLAVDSPGGHTDGLFETLDAIAQLRATSKKSIKVRAENALSAAYGIAAAAGPIEATSRAALFGSIGTAMSFSVDPQVVTLTNSDSPNKRPDVTTDAGKAVVVEFLDQVNDELVRAIARGRDVDAKTVTETFGRGAMLTAPNAQRLGMIDKTATTPLRAVTSKRTAMATQKDDDSPEETRAAADAAAETRGTTRERDRVLAHLTLGESSGDMSIALEAIRSGAAMTQELTARYLTASMNRSDRSKRQTESTDASRAVEGSSASSPAPDLGDLVVAQLTASNGSHVRG
jgi:ClpP class serine protease